MVVTPQELETILGHAVAEYPHESCGVVLVRDAQRELVRCRNVQDALHRRDPARYPRDARTAYYIDPQDLLQIGRREGQDWSVAVIYHSHVDAGAYFSETDRRQALMAGEPTYPRATYLVTSVVERRVAAVAAFRWDEGRRDFLPVDLGTRWPEKTEPAR